MASKGWQRLGIALVASAVVAGPGTGCEEAGPEARRAPDGATASGPGGQAGEHRSDPIAGGDPGARSPRCADADPDRNVYFGDLHVHTALSSDAWLFDVRTTPEDAYRYGFGGHVDLPPLDAAGRPTRRHANPRPLDFMAVTDHAEFLGELEICTTPGREGHGSEFCEDLRSATGRAPALIEQIVSPFPSRDPGVCGDDGERCAAATRDLWGEIQDAAARWNDPCRRTTFVGYEYSSFRMGSNLHRNVLFRNEIVPEQPTSYLEAVRVHELWEALARDFLDAGTGCDVLAIPHNSNISNGRMFAVSYPGAWTRSAKVERARLRARLEPVVEIMQHKGDSECRNGLPGVAGGVDELCGFEKLTDAIWPADASQDEIDECYAGWGADWWLHRGPDCLSPLSYVRYALIEGLRQEAELGVNPFKLGLMASTDTHNGIAGAVEERDFPGHLGIGDDRASERTSRDREIPGNAGNNPGGLVGVWATENTRDALFDAMRRREVFGTSGPRMRVRMFGGWDLDPGLCGTADRVARADAAGVAMGGDLPRRAPKGPAAPSFLLMAQADPGTADAPGVPLERLQIVKGWIDADGRMHQRVHDVADGRMHPRVHDVADGRMHPRVHDVAGVGAPTTTVDPDTCVPPDAGPRDLCAVWTDPDFEAERRAVYYLRAVQTPTCRYSRIQCLALAPEERPAACEDERTSRTLRERAWSSPIWYAPDV